MTVVDPQEPMPPACPICRLVRKGLLTYLDDLIYSCGVDPQVRRELRLARGLCNRHAHLFTEVVGLALGVTLIGWDVIDTVNEDLGKHKDTKAQRSGVDFGEFSDRPRSCALAQPTRTITLRLRVLSERAWAASTSSISKRSTSTPCLSTCMTTRCKRPSARSPGLCLPHFGQAVQWAPDADEARSDHRDRARGVGQPQRRAAGAGPQVRPSISARNGGSGRRLLEAVDRL